MRHRNLLNVLKNDPDIPHERTFTYTYQPERNSQFLGATPVGGHYLESISDMYDHVALRHEVRVDPKTQSWRRLKAVKPPPGSWFDKKGRIHFQPHSCHHVVQRWEPERSLAVNFGKIEFPGNYAERADVSTYTYLLGHELIVNEGGDLSSTIPSGDKSYTSSAYVGTDWFDLVSRFDEACNNIIPSSFFLGEDIIECDIFVDALKIVINPTSAIKNLLKISKDIIGSKKLRKMSLGQVSRHLTSKVVNSGLSYQFGIRPAVADILDALNAHKKVSSRLKELRSKQGSYLPVRVRTENPCDISNSDLGANSPDSLISYFTHCESKSVVSAIGAWGRVREDLNFGDTWSAYLEYFGIGKIIGLAWELIPFSFVVDWFTDTKQRLNYLTRTGGRSPFTEFRGFTASRKEELVETLKCRLGFSLPKALPIISPDVPFTIGKIRSSTYDRYTDLSEIPSTSGGVDLSQLGALRWTELLGLIIQRIV